MGKILLIMILIGTFCVSACGREKQADIRVGVVRKVQDQAETAKLSEYEIRQKIADTKQQSTEKLAELRKQSVENYRKAGLNTHIVERREREKAELRALRVQVETQAEEKFAAHKQTLEETYQLKLFNMRMQLESLRMRPKERDKLEQEIIAVRRERELKLQVLEMEKHAYIEEQLRADMQK